MQFANTDSFQLPEDAISVPLAVLANDIGVLSIVDFTQPANGQVSLMDGELLYTPNLDFVGTTSFTYTAQDSSGEQASTLVEIEVVRSHEQPQSSIDARIAPEISPSGLELVVSKYAKLPGIPRVNSFDTVGDRIFVSTEGNSGSGAEIYEIIRDPGGTVAVELFFDVRAALAQQSVDLNKSSFFSQGGLRSIAFHPDFDSNGKLYVSAVVERPSNTNGLTYISSPASASNLDSLVAEFSYDAVTGSVDASSYREVFRYGHPQNFNHPIKEIEFNPFAQPGDEDYGLLYVSTGDGAPNGQNVTLEASQNNDALGKMLRINPLQNGSDSYSVPATNPFVGDPSYLDEIWAVGLRNEHTFSFNRAPNGDTYLISTGIGYDNIDEVNIITAGDNLGWGFREGHFVVDEAGGNTTGLSALPSNEATFDYRYPATFVAHDAPIGTVGDVGQALAGGFTINNGSELDGQFIFADFAESSRFYHVPFEELLAAKTELAPGESPSTLSWATPSELTILYNHDSDTSTTPIVQTNLKDILGSFRSDVRFGQGPNGEMFITNKRDGWIYIVENSVPGVYTPPPRPSVVYNGNTYQLGTPGLTWEEANAEAQRLGGHLVTISDAAENDFVVETFGGEAPIWLGLTDQATEGTFVTTTGETVTYTNWLPGEPNNNGGAQDFAVIASTDGKWDDGNNAGELFFDGSWKAGFTNLTVIEFEGTAASPLDAQDDQYTVKADASLIVTSAGSELGIIQNDRFTGDEPVITAVNGQVIPAQGASQFNGSNGGIFNISSNGELSFNPNGEFDNLLVNATATTAINYTIEQQDNSSDTATVIVTVVGVTENPPDSGNTVAFNGNTYQLGTPGLTWEEANAEAQRLGGHLVTISDAAENDFVVETFGGEAPIWLGLTDQATEGTFVTTTGETVTYTNWLPGEPNNDGGVQDFAVIASADGKWDDGNNTGGFFFDGSWKSGFTNLTVIEFEGNSDDVITFNGNRYQRGTSGLTWEEANAEAEALGGHLVTINDEAENNFVVETFGADALSGWQPIWIGLTDSGTEGAFEWTNGEIFLYENWLPGEPNNDGNQDYATIGSANGQWDDISNQGGYSLIDGAWQGGQVNLSVIEFPGSEF